MTTDVTKSRSGSTQPPGKQSSSGKDLINVGGLLGNVSNSPNSEGPGQVSLDKLF